MAKGFCMRKKFNFFCVKKAKKKRKKKDKVDIVVIICTRR